MGTQVRREAEMGAGAGVEPAGGAWVVEVMVGALVTREKGMVGAARGAAAAVKARIVAARVKVVRRVAGGAVVVAAEVMVVERMAVA